LIISFGNITRIGSRSYKEEDGTSCLEMKSHVAHIKKFVMKPSL